MTHQADLELARRVGRGDERASDQFVTRHVDGLYNFLFWRCGRDHATTEDLVQETMLAAVRSVGRYDGRASLAAWLKGIARHCLGRWRRGRAGFDPLADALAAAESATGPVRDLLGDEPLPAEAFERQEVRDAVQAVLAGMPADEAAALDAKYRHDRSVGEIAARLGRSVKATESLLSRARRRFHTAFARVYSELTP